MHKSWIFKEKGDAGGWVEHSENDLPNEPVLIDVVHSAINYKDALSITRAAPISRKFPMVPGVDIVGVVKEDMSGTFKAGDRVVATGFGLGEVHWGGYTTAARLKPEWLVKLPHGISNRDAAAAGTAGLTAAMCIEALENYGLPLESGEIVVSGATGGVGSFALRLLDTAGYHAVAMTGRPEEKAYLLAQGAKDIVARSEFDQDVRPLAKERWAAGIDVAGGKILANILSTTRYGGSIAACGLAASMELPASVAPFILRGVNLLGVDSVLASREKREKAWKRIEAAIAIHPLDDMVYQHKFEDVTQLAEDLLASKSKGRIVLGWH
ncbi:acryloyl-CoA reductase [Rhizobium laguerreae]|uniref:Acryloyl-CoA reductase n=1 Tax=Rhizobium laguerreae TaxID=1076926 RepID=A0AB35FCZ1_9HYPH|nr:acryloyl-CoA reductase [Rhizobium laguerreae]MBY3064544.1 acryloyl-CoA reductase [Rhizobium laguerreae]